MSNKTINYINQLIDKKSKDKQENATYQINQNLELSKMDKKQMLQFGNFIYGIKKEFPSIEFLEYGKSKLGKQPLFLGKGKDPKNNIGIIEIVEFERDKEQAIQKAIKHKQFSIGDISKEEEIIL